MASFDLFANFSLTGRSGLSQGDRASYREAVPLIGMLSLSKGRPGPSHGGQAAHREAGPFTGRQGLSQGGKASHREARPLTGMPGPLTE